MFNREYNTTVPNCVDSLQYSYQAFLQGFCFPSDNPSVYSNYLNNTFNVYDSDRECTSNPTTVVTIDLNTCENSFTLQSQSQSVLEASNSQTSSKLYAYPMLLTSNAIAVPTLSPVINPRGQWITGLYYTEPNCLGSITQFQTLLYPNEGSGFIIPSGCNIYVPSIDEYSNDDSFSDVASIYFTYSMSYPGLPTDMLPEGVSFGART